MTTKQLYAKYTETRESRKKKGAGKGYKVTVRTQWRDGMSMYGFMSELRQTNRIAYAIELCRVEFANMVTDRWWDCDACRKSEIKAYRSRIAAIRKEYGLSYETVSGFYNVD